MPYYEYECKKCGIIEVRQSITDEALKKCPVCDAKIKRILSATADPQLTGSGFYTTDYVKKS